MARPEERRAQDKVVDPVVEEVLRQARTFVPDDLVEPVLPDVGTLPHVGQLPEVSAELPAVLPDWVRSGNLPGLSPKIEQRPRPPGRLIVRRRLVVIPPTPPPTMTWWSLPFYEYEDLFDGVFEDSPWPTGNVLDFDDVVGEMSKRGDLKLFNDVETRTPGLNATELIDFADAFQTWDDLQTPAALWDEAMDTWHQLRNDLADHAYMLENLGLEGTEHIEAIGIWAGLDERETRELTTRKILKAIEDDRLQGLGAAAIDYVSWNAPEAFGGRMGSDLRTIRHAMWDYDPKRGFPRRPMDIFLFPYGLHLNHVNGTWKGRRTALLRGEYLVGEAHYVSQMARLEYGMPLPHGLPGWRLIRAIPSGKAVHVCGADCWENNCGCNSQPLATLVEDGRDRNEAGCCEPDCPWSENKGGAC